MKLGTYVVAKDGGGKIVAVKRSENMKLKRIERLVHCTKLWLMYATDLVTSPHRHSPAPGFEDDVAIEQPNANLIGTNV